MLECACFFHQGKQVVIAAKKHMQAHLDMVAVFVQPTADFAAHKGAGFKKFYFIALLAEFDCRTHTR